MKEEVLFSVAVITYNQERYIAQTLDSILFQEHNYKYEIVVGEDCSTDNTRKIIEDYVLKYPDIIKPIYNQKNLGLIKNYYNVISNCSGKYIMECAGDDWWLQGKVKTQIEFMESHNDVGMCYGKAQCYNFNNQFMGVCKGIECGSFDEVLEQNPIPAVTVCFRNELMQQYIRDIMPMSKDWQMEDYPIWLWFYKKSMVSFIPASLACYKYSNESVSNTKNIEKQISFLKSTYDVRNFFAAKYEGRIQNVETDEMFRWLSFKQLLNSYDSERAKKMRKEILQKYTLKNIVKSVIISNVFFAKIAKIVVK